MAFDMSPQDNVLLAPALGSQRRRWQGVLELTEGSGAPASFNLSLQMEVAEGRVSGDGLTQMDDKVEIFGSYVFSCVTLEIVIHRSARLAFQCHGEINGELASMAGAATLGCVFPDDCACLGHRGKFHIYQA